MTTRLSNTKCNHLHVDFWKWCEIASVFGKILDCNHIAPFHIILERFHVEGIGKAIVDVGARLFISDLINDGVERDDLEVLLKLGEVRLFE